MSFDFEKYNDEVYDEHRKWWSKQAENKAEPTRWPDSPDKTVRTTYSLMLDPALGKQWRKIVKGSDKGEFVVFLTAVQLFIRKALLTECPTLIILNDHGIAPFFCTIDPNSTFKENVSNTREYWVLWRKYADFPLQIPFGSEAVPNQFSDIFISSENVHGELESNAPLHLHLRKIDNNFVIDVTLHQSISITAETVAKGLLSVLEYLFDLDTPIAEMRLCNTFPPLEIEHERIQNYPQKTTIISRFLEVAKKYKGRNALSFNDDVYTYEALLEEVELVAGHLIHHGVKPDDTVAVITERSPRMIVALLAVLRAGGNYLPIDPLCPDKRIHRMLVDAHATHLLHERSFTSVWADIQLVCLDDLDHKPAAVTYPDIQPDQRAYIMYTSGSTDAPKGVEITHANVVSLLLHNELPYDFSKNDVWCMYHDYTFDFSVWEMYGALLYGGKLVIPTLAEVKDPAFYADLLHDEAVSVLNTTPAVFNAISSHLCEDKGDIRIVIFGGETLHPHHLTDFHHAHPDVDLINMYGITETTVHVTHHHFNTAQLRQGASWIGKALPAAQVILTDLDDLPQLPGMPGEMWICGAGLGKGYVNDDERTEARYTLLDGVRYYKSGDLAQWHGVGLEFLGRRDEQIKIHGYRIETAEIGHYILQQDAVNAVHIGAVKDAEGDQKLVAWVVADLENVSVLEDHLRGEVPAYMIPDHWVKVERIPLTKSGKINTKKLPDPLETDNHIKTKPSSKTEKALEKMWRSLLFDVDYFKESNFFEVGGNAHTANYLKARIETEFKVELSLATLYRNADLQEMATAIEQAASKQTEKFPKAPEQDTYPLGPGQYTQYLLHQYNKAGSTNNLPTTMLLEGTLFPVQLQDMVDEIVQHHAALRTSFVLDGKHVKQCIHQNVHIHVEWHFCSKKKALEILDQEIHAFALHEVPLLKVTVCRIQEDQHLLHFNLPYIITDQRSNELMIRDFLKLYHGQSIKKPEHQYVDLAHWYASDTGRQAMRAHKTYWLEQFQAAPPQARIKPVALVEGVNDFSGKDIHHRFSLEETEALLKMAKNQRTTPSAILFAALFYWMKVYTGESDLVIGTKVDGRDYIHFSDVIGNFENTLPIRLEVVDNEDFYTLLQSVKNRTTEAYGHQNYPIEHLIKALGLDQRFGRNPLFDVCFNFQDDGSLLTDSDVSGFKSQARTNHFSRNELDITCRFDGKNLSTIWQYSENHYTAREAEQMIEQYNYLLRAILKHPHKRLQDIQLSEPDDLEAALQQHQGPSVAFPPAATFPALFLECVEKFAVNIAVSDPEEHLTYAQLGERAQGIAASLESRGLHSGDVVAVIAPKSAWQIAAFCGIMMQGMVILPIDPDLAEDAILHQLEISKAKAIITDFELHADMFDGVLMRLSKTRKQAPKSKVTVAATDPACITFTAESDMYTHSHQAIANTALWLKVTFGIQASSNGFIHPQHEDKVQLAYLMPWLGSGAALHIAPAAALSAGNNLARWIRAKSITHALLNQHALHDICKKKVPTLEVAFIPHHSQQKQFTAPFRIVATYGDVVTGGIVIWKELQDKSAAKWLPVANMAVHIQNANGHYLPDGIFGEVVFMGNSLAMGYENGKATGLRGSWTENGLVIAGHVKQSLGKKEIRAFRENARENEMEGPRSFIERNIRNYWKTVLDVKDVGVTTDFFEAGGNTDKLVHLYHLMQEQYPGKFALYDLMKQSTVRQQAVHVRSAAPKRTAV